MNNIEVYRAKNRTSWCWIILHSCTSCSGTIVGIRLSGYNDDQIGWVIILI